MEQHKKCLEKRCRVCGRKPIGYLHSKYSKKCDSLLSTLLNISVTTESEDIYPPVVCNSCYITLKKTKEADKNIVTTALSTFAWEPQSDYCQVCLVWGNFCCLPQVALLAQLQLPLTMVGITINAATRVQN